MQQPAKFALVYLANTMKKILNFFKGQPPESAEALVPPSSHADKSSLTENSSVDVRSVVTDIGGRKYRVESDDNYLEHIKGVFEPDLVSVFDSLITPSDIVLDVGANIGCTSILFGSRAAKVFSFEPSPTTFKFLEKNVLGANLPNVSPQNFGLGKASGSFELTFAADNRSGGFVSNKVVASAGHTVESIKIVQGDVYLETLGLDRVDFIKIDVEGFEQDVIEGLHQTIEKSKPVVVLELNHWCLNVFQRKSVPDFFDFLRNIFPYLYAIDASDIRNLHNTDDAYHVMYHHVVGGFKYPNIVGSIDPAKLKVFSERFSLNLYATTLAKKQDRRFESKDGDDPQDLGPAI
jgi:FkbM family methyltransferase